MTNMSQFASGPLNSVHLLEQPTNVACILTPNHPHPTSTAKPNPQCHPSRVFTRQLNLFASSRSELSSVCTYPPQPPLEEPQHLKNMQSLGYGRLVADRLLVSACRTARTCAADPKPPTINHLPISIFKKQNPARTNSFLLLDQKPNCQLEVHQTTRLVRASTALPLRVGVREARIPFGARAIVSTSPLVDHYQPAFGTSDNASSLAGSAGSLTARAGSVGGHGRLSRQARQAQ
ncbi:hypothetical protein BKA70DRAFT_1219855 [Coprinopsis sp. MPI-PUGE-AT-0042]|nr:hypothetical protein BKA70DRAFT_1219855 [Coprinopsis sp. MPI-PUGE-AT-0042]